MPTTIAVAMFVGATAPLVMAVDFFFYRPTARKPPSRLWLFGFFLPWALLILAIIANSRGLLVPAFLLGLVFPAAWIWRRRRS